MLFEKIFSCFIVLILGLGTSNVVQAQGDKFAKLDFGGAAYIEVPRSWTYLDKELNKRLNTFSESIARLAGVPPNPGQNIILVAGKTYTSFHTSSATLRLSIRHGNGPNQTLMQEIAKLSKPEVAQFLSPIANQTQKAMVRVAGVRSAKAVDAKVAAKKGLICIFMEFETDASDGLKLSQTYICPLGNRSVKLSTSYRKSEAKLFRPIVEHVWNSLRIK